MAAFQQLLTLSSESGVPNVGFGDFITSGPTMFVSSVSGASTNSGLTPDAPLDSLSNALILAPANVGTNILILPAHVESPALGFDINCEGVRIVGLGEGDNRPLFRIQTGGTDPIALVADNVTIENCIFTSDADTPAIVTMEGAYGSLINCDFLPAADTPWLTAITVAAADNCRILGCTFVSTAVGATAAIEIAEALDRLEIAGCTVFGDYGSACIHNPTGKVATNLNIHHNYLQNNQTGDHSIELVSACTGFLAFNCYANDMTQATGVDPGSCFSFQCFHCDAVDVSGILTPVAT